MRRSTISETCARPSTGPGQPRECAERDELGDHTGHDVADVVARDEVLPLLGCGTADRERDLLVLAVHPHHEDVDLLADLEQRLGVAVAIPGQFGEVGETVGAAEVDEDPEVADRRDLAGADLALGELTEQALLLGGAPFLHGGALGQDGAVAAAIDLDHLHAQAAAHHLGQRVRALGAGLGAHHLRHRDEGVHALDVGEQAALVEAGDLRVEDLAALEPLL